MVETLSKNITRQGLTATTLNYLRVSSSITNIEPVVSEAGVPPPPIDPDSLPLPSAHTLTGQTIPSSSMENAMDFGGDNFTFQ